MQIGDKVEAVSIPTDLPQGELQTRSLFEKCLGRVFSIVGFQGDLLELEVGAAVGEVPCMQSIWIERKHVKLSNC